MLLMFWIQDNWDGGGVLLGLEQRAARASSPRCPYNSDGRDMEWEGHSDHFQDPEAAAVAILASASARENCDRISLQAFLMCEIGGVSDTNLTFAIASTN